VAQGQMQEGEATKMQKAEGVVPTQRRQVQDARL